MNLKPLAVETNPEPDEVNQGLAGSEQPNEPPFEGDEVDYEESASKSDRKMPRRAETPVSRLKDEVKDLRDIMNQVLMETVKNRRASSGETRPVVYMKNMPKRMTWDTRDKRNIEAFLTEYEAYCDAAGYISDAVWVRNFGYFLKEGASMTFANWRRPCVRRVKRLGGRCVVKTTSTSTRRHAASRNEVVK